MRWVPAALAVVLLALPAFADPPKEPTVDELIADLGHPAFGTREKAQRELWKRGDAAVPALERAVKSDDPETVRRARELLSKFEWGIRPDTPPAVLKLIRQYQTGDPNNPARTPEVRREAVGKLLAEGRAGASAVRAILKKDLPADARAHLVGDVLVHIRKQVPLLLMANKRDEADELISLLLAGTTHDGAADLAAYHVLRGDVPSALARAEAAFAAGKKSDAQRLALVYLHRAAGNYAKARKLAEDLPADAERASFKEILLEEEGDWAALADTGPGRQLNHPDAVKLTLLRLAGRDQEFDKLAKRVRADADELSDPDDILSSATALFSNHRAAEATELLLEKKKPLALLSEVLISRMRYKDALDLIGNGAKEKETIAPNERLNFNLRRARVLMVTGYRDDALQVFEHVANGLRTGRDEQGFTVAARALIRTELRVGLRDLACEHAARFVPDSPEGRFVGNQGESPFELIFPNDAQAAESLYAALRTARIPGAEGGATMLRTRDLLTGQSGKAAVDEALRALKDSITALGADPRLMKARRYLALAQVCRAAGRHDAADEAYKVAAELTEHATDAGEASGTRSWVYGAPDPARVWIEWGEALAARGRHRDAATVLEAGWKLFPNQPLPLFLSGRALLAAGDEAEGKRRIELAHWVTLGNDKLRGRFLDELNTRGAAPAIKREIQLITKACWSHDHFFGNVMNQCARGAALVGDFATAEVCAQRSLLVVLRTLEVYFVDVAAYLTVPHELLVYRARALLNAGKVEEAMERAKAVLAITPSHFDLVTGMVPQLDRAGRKKEADELFALARAAHEKTLKDYPDSAAARHALAALAGRCNRDLDTGLKYAQEALKADRANPAHREALAELLFRKGDRPEALKLMEKLAAEFPRSALYARQLSRYRAAAFDSAWPLTE